MSCKDRQLNIIIVAKHMPGDYDIEYASPWAGADWVPPKASLGIGNPDPNVVPYEATTWPELERLAREVPEAGIHFQDAVYYLRKQDADTQAGDWFAKLSKTDHWLWKTVPETRVLDQSELPSGMTNGLEFTSVCINTALYLPWLASQCLKFGVEIRRGMVDHVSEAESLHRSGRRAQIVINCTGLSSLRLRGVEDNTLFPSRGQIVLVRNNPNNIAMVSSTEDGPEENMYIMTRAAGGGTILGGCSQRHNWKSQPDPSLAVRIMTRAIQMSPDLVPKGKGIEALSVIRHGVGLRPMRENGIRLERETVQTKAGQDLTVVHNYGHGGVEYQTSYACAAIVVELVHEGLRPRTKL